jgi:flagellar motility protein MotE (MotC chaperone)
VTLRVVSVLLASGVAAATLGGVSFAAGANRRETEAASLQELAEQLSARERSLDRREATIADREGDLRKAASDLEARLAELTSLRTEIDGRMTVLTEAEEERVRALVRMVEGNRPKDIAPWVEALDPELAARIIGRMQAAKAGKLLAALAPERAASLSERLADPADLP